MKTIKLILASSLMIISLLLSAQPIIFNDSTIQNSIYTRAGIEPASMIGFGYQRNVNANFLRQTITLYAECNFAAFKFNWDNSELKIGAITPIYQIKSFKIINNFNLSLGSVVTQNFESKKFAFANEIAFGIYKQKWHLALTAEYEKIYLNYLAHSDFYKTTYYEDAVDGWYTGAGGMFQVGIEVGKTFYQKFDVNLELKMPVTEKFNAYLSPGHANLIIGYRF